VLHFVRLGGQVHVEHPRLDTTLCGCALEGEEDVDPAVNVPEQAVTCPECLLIIRLARDIPARLLGGAKRRAGKAA
jgi:hypothetical protein